MRITKKWLRAAKEGLATRFSVYCKMDSQKILETYKEHFPHAPQLTDECEALRLLILEGLEIEIPGHMTD